jgi:hypothetical protein
MREQRVVIDGTGVSEEFTQEHIESSVREAAKLLLKNKYFICIVVENDGLTTIKSQMRPKDIPQLGGGCLKMADTLAKEYLKLLKEMEDV